MPDISKDNLFNFSHTRSPHFKTMDFHSHDNFEIYVFADGYITYYIDCNELDVCIAAHTHGINFGFITK